MRSDNQINSENKMKFCLYMIRFISGFDFDKPNQFLFSFAITRATAPLVRGIAEECGELDYGVGGIIPSYPSITSMSKF